MFQNPLELFGAVWFVVGLVLVVESRVRRDAYEGQRIWQFRAGLFLIAFGILMVFTGL